MALFYYAHELRQPANVQPFLADPELHWRRGFSAYELATRWIRSGGFPDSVRAVLDTCPAYAGLDFIEGFFERQVDLRTPGRRSQTDLMVLARQADSLRVIAVEGKVNEPFGPLVSRWNKTAGRVRRLVQLCRILGLDESSVSGLRYQLLHRTASALIEAERYGAKHALLLVHSFSNEEASLKDYQQFANAMYIQDAQKGDVSGAVHIMGIELRLVWVSDKTTTARREKP